MESCDFHIHSMFSDGLFSPEQIVQAAIEKNISHIALTDHYLTRKTKSIPQDQLQTYIDAVRSLAETFRSSINILVGIEIDIPDLVRTGRNLPSSDMLQQLDFILFEYVTDRPLNGIPLDYIVRLRETIPCAVGLAHVDISTEFPGKYPGKLLEILENNNIFLELNESYASPGDLQPFYMNARDFYQEAVSRDVLFSVGSDMHRSLSQLGAREALRFLDEANLSSKIIHHHL